MRNIALFPPGGHRIQVPQCAPTDTNVCMCVRGILVTAGWGWKLWLFAKLLLTASWLGRRGVPPLLHGHKERTSLLCDGDESLDFRTRAPLQWEGEGPLITSVGVWK